MITDYDADDDAPNYIDVAEARHESYMVWAGLTDASGSHSNRQSHAVEAPELRVLLDFEETHPSHGVAKDEAILSTFGMPPARYYQLLFVAMADPALLELRAALINRLTDLRTQAVARRAARTFTRSIS
jgi:hypothetical protein